MLTSLRFSKLLVKPQTRFISFVKPQTRFISVIASRYKPREHAVSINHDIKPFAILFKDAYFDDRFIFNRTFNGCRILFFKKCSMHFIRFGINEYTFPNLEEIVFYEENSTIKNKYTCDTFELEYSLNKENNNLLITNDYGKLKEYNFSPSTKYMYFGFKKE